MLQHAVGNGGGPYIRGDVEALPFRNGAFDAAMFVTVLEFVPDPGSALREAARICRRGLLLGVLNRWSVLAASRRLRGGPAWSHARFFSPPEPLELITQPLRSQLESLEWDTTLLPRGLGSLARLLPVGGFIGVRVALAKDSEAMPTHTDNGGVPYEPAR